MQHKQEDRITSESMQQYFQRTSKTLCNIVPSFLAFSFFIPFICFYSLLKEGSGKMLPAELWRQTYLNPLTATKTHLLAHFYAFM